MNHSATIQTRTNNSANSGIQPYSQECAGKEYLIFASDMLDANVIHLLNERNVPYKDLIGRYRMDDGRLVQETSFIVERYHYNTVYDIIRGQESVLILERQGTDKLRHATLYYIGQYKREYVGQFMTIKTHEAFECDNMTYDPYLDQHFTTSMDTKSAKARVSLLGDKVITDTVDYTGENINPIN